MCTAIKNDITVKFNIDKDKLSGIFKKNIKVFNFIFIKIILIFRYIIIYQRLCLKCDIFIIYFSNKVCILTFNTYKMENYILHLYN